MLSVLFLSFLLFQGAEHRLPIEPPFAAFDPLLEPVELRLHLDHLVAPVADAVRLPGVNNELGRDAQFLKRHVEFFALRHGNA